MYGPVAVTGLSTTIDYVSSIKQLPKFVYNLVLTHNVRNDDSRASDVLNLTEPNRLSLKLLDNCGRGFGRATGWCYT